MAGPRLGGGVTGAVVDLTLLLVLCAQPRSHAVLRTGALGSRAADYGQMSHCLYEAGGAAEAPG